MNESELVEEQNAKFGHEIMRRMFLALAERPSGTWIQLVDLFESQTAAKTFSGGGDDDC